MLKEGLSYIQRALHLDYRRGAEAKTNFGWQLDRASFSKRQFKCLAFLISITSELLFTEKPWLPEMIVPVNNGLKCKKLFQELGALRIPFLNKCSHFLLLQTVHKVPLLPAH